MQFSEQLAFVLEEDNNSGKHDISDAVDILRQLETAKSQISDLEYKLDSIKNRINANLAVKIKRTNPGLNVSVDRKGCKIGYKSKSLIFNPDLSKGIWLVTSEDTRFLNRFLRRFKKDIVISGDVYKLVSVINNYFADHYKSLGEDIIGTGIVLLENKKVSVSELAKYWLSLKRAET